MLSLSTTYNFPVVGRFAPSPTGYLHLGSLLTAVASYCIAKQTDGQWYLRIEDTDTQRCRPEYSAAILHDLEHFGLWWDGEVRYQSAHLDSYHSLLDQKLQTVTYACDCSRKTIAHHYRHQLPIHASQTQTLDHTALPYPRICVSRRLPRHHAIRLILPDHTMVFYDKLQGLVWGNPQQTSGDIVLRRAATNKTLSDGMINYMLAAVVDDATQGINQVVRGLDILPLTIPQLALINYLGYPAPSYYHLPILINAQGQKLSKQTLAEPIRHYSPQQLIPLILKLLGQKPVEIADGQAMLRQAISQWDSRPLQHVQHIRCPEPITDMKCHS